jgi:hypothetical protein
MERLITGNLRAPSQIGSRYRFILNAPHGHRTARANYVAAESGMSCRNMFRHLNKIEVGQVTADGVPVRRKPGPPKGFIPTKLLLYFQGKKTQEGQCLLG